MTSNGTYPKWKNKDEIIFGSKHEVSNLEYKYIINSEQVSQIIFLLFSLKQHGKMVITAKLIYPNFLRVDKLLSLRMRVSTRWDERPKFISRVKHYWLTAHQFSRTHRQSSLAPCQLLPKPTIRWLPHTPESPVQKRHNLWMRFLISILKTSHGS